MNQQTLTTCPNCGVQLVMEGIEPGQIVVCGQCRRALPGSQHMARTSLKAVISLILGILSLWGAIITGIPAMILGLLALRDIRRDKDDRLQGRQLAIGGICLALAFNLVYFGFFAWIFKDQISVAVADMTSTTIISAGSQWRWLHPVDGTDPATNDPDFHSTFFRLDYDDSHWQIGTDGIGSHAGFGYGDDVSVDIGEPPDGQHRKTAYFRHRFVTKSDFDSLYVKLQRDDGVIIYVDGVEVARDNMQEGDEAYDLYAASTVGGAGETTSRRIDLADGIDAGEHVIAISLHNHGGRSSDLRLAEVSLSGR